MPQITLPTRETGIIATLIDNILINSYDNKCTSGIIITSVSNHFPHSLINENFKDKTYKIKKKPKAAVRDYKDFDCKSFPSN